MLADDEGIVIDSLKFIIEKEFKDICEVQYAKTGRSVIELAESFRPDIAVMDIQMPGINGIDAMKEIRRTNNHTVFIVMSAYDKFDYAKELQPYKGIGLCSECGRLATSPDGRDVVVPGKWHGKFPKKKATEEELKRVGYKNLIR